METAPAALFASHSLRKILSLSLKDSGGGYEYVPVQTNAHKTKRIAATIMKTSLLTTLASAALLAVAVNTHAQRWETILDLDGQSSRAIIVDPFSSIGTWPNLLVTGAIPGLNDLSGTPYKVFRLSQSDVPTPETPVLGALHASGATVYSMVSDPLGNLYWAGGLNTSTGLVWIVRLSGDGGGNWQEVQRWKLAGGGFAEARGVTVDDAGRVVVCGMAIDATGVSHWITQISENQGGAWVTKDLFKGSGVASFVTGYNIVEGLGTTFVPGPNGGLFTVGTRGSKSYGAWTVLRSRDGGDNWQVVDSWVPKNIGSTRARKVTTDGVRIFVLGDSGGRTERDPSPWVVRASANGGDTWQTIFGPWSYGPGVYPLDFTIDAAGDIWIAGVVHKTYGNNKNSTFTTIATVVRLHETQPGSWTPTEYPISPEAQGVNRAEASAITADPLGHVYVSGSFKANDASPWQWFVQRMVP